MIKILVVTHIPYEPFLHLPKGWSYKMPVSGHFSKEEIIELLPDYDILLASFNLKVDKDIIDAGTKLRLISNFGVGFNHIDTHYAREKGIAVTNCPEAVTKPTAELAMGIMLAQARRISYCDSKLRSKQEEAWGVMANLGNTLEGKTLGIIGMGRIGQEMARKASAFDMNIIYFNRSPKNLHYRQVALDELLQCADFISLHIPLTSNTHHLISSVQFAQMKPSAVIVNTARGPIIDEAALVTALQNQTISGAALDVYEFEPKISQQLYSMNNVVIVPHIGTATFESRITMSQEAVNNCINFINNTPTNIVN